MSLALYCSILPLQLLLVMKTYLSSTGLCLVGNKQCPKLDFHPYTLFHSLMSSTYLLELTSVMACEYETESLVIPTSDST